MPEPPGKPSLVYKLISCDACAAQRFFSAASATLENYFLTLVACDHCAAVCKPLNYTTTITLCVCAHLIIAAMFVAS